MCVDRCAAWAHCYWVHVELIGECFDQPYQRVSMIEQLVQGVYVIVVANLCISANCYEL